MPRCSLYNHIKLRRLCKLLQIPRPLAVGHLALLEHYVGENYPTGDISSMSNDDIELAAEWDGEPGAFLHAALRCRLIDRDDAGTRLHDWLDWCPRWVIKRLAREYGCRESEVTQRASTGRPLGAQQVPAGGPTGVEEKRSEGKGSIPPLSPPGGGGRRPTKREQEAQQRGALEKLRQEYDHLPPTVCRQLTEQVTGSEHGCYGLGGTPNYGAMQKVLLAARRLKEREDARTRVGDIAGNHGRAGEAV